MTVCIHDGYSFNAEFMADVFDHDGFDINVAEAARAVGDKHGMMAGRTHEGKGVIDFTGQHFLCGGDRASG